MSSSQETTGKRLVVWLQALRSALRLSGYWSGVVRCFSIRQPRTRSSTRSRSMRGSVRSARETECRPPADAEAVEREEAAVVRAWIVEPGTRRSDVERCEVVTSEEAARGLLGRHVQLVHQLAGR